MQQMEFTDDDEGKKVVHGSETVGRVVDVEHGTAYIDPDPGLTDKIEAKLGWGDQASDEDTYPLQEQSVEAITEDEIQLSDQL